MNNISSGLSSAYFQLHRFQTWCLYLWLADEQVSPKMTPPLQTILEPLHTHFESANWESETLAHAAAAFCSWRYTRAKRTFPWHVYCRTCHFTLNGEKSARKCSTDTVPIRTNQGLLCTSVITTLGTREHPKKELLSLTRPKNTNFGRIKWTKKWLLFPNQVWSQFQNHSTRYRHTFLVPLITIYSL